MNFAEDVKIDEDKVNQALHREVPLILTTYTLPRRVEKYIEKVVSIFLEQINQEQLKDQITYCVQELVVNAKKANTKRVYFIEQGLDLSDPEDYATGMESFKEDTLKNITYYLQLQKKRGLYIKVILRKKNSAIQIEVRNNAAMTNTEFSRVHNRLIKARQYDNLEDALVHVLDDSEGAGLGLVLLTQMMKKIGLDQQYFSIEKTDTETIARILIPPIAL
jgi:hypothetical protein